MNIRNTISDELKALDSQLSAGMGHPYSLPLGYFDSLADNIMARIRVQDGNADQEIESLSPLLAGISRKMPYSIPSNYFEESLGDAKLVNSEEEESLVLSFISKEMPYQVPTGYFANIPDQVMDRIREKNKIVPVMRNKWMRMAVAAVMAGIITLSGILYFNQDNAGGSDQVAIELKKASTEELDAFIKNTAGVNAGQPQVSTSVSEEAKALLDDVSDKELEAFLSAIPTEELPLADDELDLLYN